MIGEYVADFLVSDLVILELQAVSELSSAHEAQIINYLRATGLEIGLLIIFGDKLELFSISGKKFLGLLEVKVL